MSWPTQADKTIAMLGKFANSDSIAPRHKNLQALGLLGAEILPTFARLGLAQASAPNPDKIDWSDVPTAVGTVEQEMNAVDAFAAKLKQATEVSQVKAKLDACLPMEIQQIKKYALQVLKKAAKFVSERAGETAKYIAEGSTLAHAALLAHIDGDKVDGDALLTLASSPDAKAMHQSLAKMNDSKAD